MEHIKLIKKLQENADELTIHIINKYDSKETFWCFLAKPKALDTGSDIFSNSSARLTLINDPTTEASFTIPVQFSLAAKSVNKPIGLGVKVSTRQQKPVELEESWGATFYTGGDHQAPSLKENGGKASENTINYSSNSFQPDKVIENDWYPTQSYGIETNSGFVGLTWEPRPQKTVKIEPLLEFYISTADYKANSLANLTTISTKLATVKLKDFKGKAVTVIYESNGDWTVKSGKPSKAN